MEEEKMNLRLDIEVQKLETEKLRKGKNKTEEELDSLKTDYKKLRLSIRTVELEKTSKQWRAEIREENDKVNRWEQKFQEVQTRNEALEKSLSESQKEKYKLKDRVTELERSLRYSAIELRASLSKIEEMKKRIEELETTLQNCEIRIEYLEVNESRFTPQHVEVYPHKSSITIKPQQFQAGASMPMDFQAGSGSNPGDNLVNPAISDFDETAGKEK
ncbi:uncharacterized protein LOC105779027 [Gossypium raimondii]|uniref:uncharacterized protein LOC105779027 n=1 Tax=Gossypium raimondii TaxID=29730 RepID=UPI00063ADBD8|nr:uncharacterized protein LOC105779027 [Gossypium raimondii]